MHRPFQHSSTPVSSAKPVIICFSHLRWDLVFQRPQHIMTRLTRDFDVVYWEEPRCESDCNAPRVERSLPAQGLIRALPVVPSSFDTAQTEQALETLLQTELESYAAPHVFWYYTPMMLGFSERVTSDLVVYDCMDELANFAFAPSDIAEREAHLLKQADIVFCGGQSLYEARRERRPDIQCFPSGVDTQHFAADKAVVADPQDQSALPSPRLGYFGVIDERMDLDLLAKMARMRPEWSFIMIGPVVKIAPSDLPIAANIHWLGGKDYTDLPGYAIHWDIALMPFACNASTRFISPTKTPEYMACGLPVISTPIKDVVDTYGSLSCIRIADTAEAFVAESESLLQAADDVRASWRIEAASCLADKGWDGIAATIARGVKGKLVTNQVTKLVQVANLAQSRPEKKRHYDVLVVGAGFAGSVMAERLARGSGKSVLVIDRRDHVGGNAYDHTDAAGILVHKYGPHIFHTNSRDIVDYLSSFTEWLAYEHRVLAAVDDQLVPMPINRTTLNMLYGLELTDDQGAVDYLRAVAIDVGTIKNSRDTVVSQVGEDLYRKFFEGYTRKQWGVDPSELDKSVAARVPARTNCDDRYFTDTFQCMPTKGYTAMFGNLLDHPAITVMTGQGYDHLPADISWDHVVWTGPIDEYFDHQLGKLPYRSLRFEHETFDCEKVQEVAVVNYPDIETPYTRITEYKHLTGQKAAKTSISREYPSDEGDPYYPIPNGAAQDMYRAYAVLARKSENVTFVGRLATYRYYNMDQIVGQALTTWRKLDARWRLDALSALDVLAAE